MPGTLASNVLVDFREIEKGIAELLNVLDLSQPKVKSMPIDTPERASAPLRRQSKEEPIPSRAIRPKTSPVVLLRSEPTFALTVAGVKKMLKEKNFFAANWNKVGKGLQHQYKTIERQGKKLVIDRTTGLTWQQSGLQRSMTFEKARARIAKMNIERFAGYAGWRLPTVEEAMSLMELGKNNDELYIDQVFNKTQSWMWTADVASASAGWVVDFDLARCYHGNVHGKFHVRAVRGG